MNDMRDLLERVGGGFEFPDHAFDRLIRRRHRRIRNQRLASALVAIVVSVVAIAALLRAFSAPPNTATPTPTPSPAITEPSAAAFVDLRSGTATALPESVTSLPEATQFVASPSGTKLAFAARGRSGSLEIFFATIGGDDVRPLTDGSTDAGFPSWSPDERRVVYLRSNGGGDSTLHMVDVFTGDASQLTEPAPLWRPSFSPGGSTIMFTKASGTSGYQPLGLWSLPMGGVKASLVVANAALGSISPDGTRIAYHRTGPAGTSSVFDGALSFIAVHGDVRNPPLEARTDMPFFGDEAGGSTLPLWSPDGSRIVYGDTAGNVTVMDVATRELTSFKGFEPSWFDDHTLIVEDYEART